MGVFTVTTVVLAMMNNVVSNIKIAQKATSIMGHTSHHGYSRYTARFIPVGSVQKNKNFPMCI